MKQVQIESPFGSNDPSVVEQNIKYARKALRDALKRGEAPYASHLLYTQEGVLDDNDPLERKHGIEAGLMFAAKADASVFYIDRGISSGMKWGYRHAVDHGREVVLRTFVNAVGGELEVARELTADSQGAYALMYESALAALGST